MQIIKEREMLPDLPWTMNHIGVVVKDLDNAVKLCELIGLGPFDSPKIEVASRELYGQPVAMGAMKLRGKFASLGSVRLELIQPVEGKSLWGDFLESKGEGLHHLGFTVDNLEKEGAELINKGFKLLFKSNYKNGGGAAYYSNSISNILIELVQN
jgi:methylmalonyl-CoA/ethylmalonyl-CoA epimerase